MPESGQSGQKQIFTSMFCQLMQVRQSLQGRHNIKWRFSAGQRATLLLSPHLPPAPPRFTSPPRISSYLDALMQTVCSLCHQTRLALTTFQVCLCSAPRITQLAPFQSGEGGQQYGDDVTRRVVESTVRLIQVLIIMLYT